MFSRLKSQTLTPSPKAIKIPAVWVEGGREGGTGLVIVGCSLSNTLIQQAVSQYMYLDLMAVNFMCFLYMQPD